MSGRESVVAVVDATSEGTAVWWVNLSPDGVSRLCGAWVVDAKDAATLESLVFKRMVLASKSGAKALAKAKVAPDRVVDINATLAAAVAERDTLQGAFDAEQSSRPSSKKLKEPRWPSFPGPLDVENPPAWDVNDSSDDHLDTAICVAHWVAALCSRWADMEEERLGRPMLRDLGGPDARMLPVVFA